MRADRLISLLLLLQRKGRVTVAEAAEELETSPRTVRRDFEALMMAGVPVYSQPGRNGGWSLIGGATTDLSGLTQDESRALLVAIGVTAAGQDPESARALRKLLQALPEPFRAAAENLATRTLLDETPWGGDTVRGDRPAAFAPVMVALAEHRVLRFTYRDRFRQVQPLGAVRKIGQWYLVADTDHGQRIFRLDRMTDTIVTHETFEMTADFDLEAAWAQRMDELGGPGNGVYAEGVIREPGTERFLRHQLQRRVTIDGDRFRAGALSTEALARDLIAFGDRIEITSPPEMRVAVAELADSVSELYR